MVVAKGVRLGFLALCAALAFRALGVVGGQSGGGGPKVPVFVEAGAEAGVNFQHFIGASGEFYLPEIMGSGAAFLDFDGDGDLDIYLVQGAMLGEGRRPDESLFPWQGPSPPSGRLFRNDLVVESGGRRRLRFTDVTDKSGIRADGYGMGIATGDFDNDGNTDLYLCNLGPNRLLRNKGDGTFEDVTIRAGVEDPRWSSSAAFVDYDRDGWLDLYVANYVRFSTSMKRECFTPTSARDYCSPSAYEPLPDRLFRNRGDGTFEDVTDRSGIGREAGPGLGVVAADFDLDGYPDIFVANDGKANLLWANRKDGTFSNEALLAGVALNRHGKADAGMGVDAGDFDGDGRDDLFLPHLMEEHSTLFANLGGGMFEDRTLETGLGSQRLRYTGFGTWWFDYDNDGWLDLMSANGAVYALPELAVAGDRHPFGQPNQLYRNLGTGRFADTSRDAGPAFALLEASRGAAFGDVDNDGDTDILINNNNGRARLFLNQVGNLNHWVGLRLVGTGRGRDMLGARVEVIRENPPALWRRAHSDGSYCSAHDPRVLIGLGANARIQAVRVHWPSGQVEEWKDLTAGRYHTLKEKSEKGLAR